MESKGPDICIRITILNPQGNPLGGTVDLEFRPHDSGDVLTVKGADASKEVDVSGLQRTPRGLYQFTVTPTDVFKPVSQFVTIPASGAAAVTITIDKGAGQGGGGGSTGGGVGPYTLSGNLVFDTGVAAGGLTTRVFGIGFGGAATLFGQTQTNAAGHYSFSYSPNSTSPNIQVRVVDSTGKEVTISATKYNAAPVETLDLVVPSSVRPLAPEFERLSVDMAKSIGGIANLGNALETAERQDLTLLNQATNWDARLVALGALAGQQASKMGLGQDVLYALFRAGLPSDPAVLATVPSTAVQLALTKAAESSIVNLNPQQISDATTAFQNFATNTLVATTARGAVSNFQDLLTPVFETNATQQQAFANLFFSQPSPNSDLWAKAAQLNIPQQMIDTLKLQGKFLYLTANNAPLTQQLQKQIGAEAELPQLAQQDFHIPDTWKSAIVAAANSAGKSVDSTIPPTYTGTTDQRLEAYAGDLARKVRISFPTHVVARMVETQEIAVDPKTKDSVAGFLRSAANAGYNLGRTPLNTFLANAGQNVPALDSASLQNLKTLHRLYQVTPSTESLQKAVSLGFTSAFQIASQSKADFLGQYKAEFPAGEAELIFGQAQTISSVTFNFFALAKQLDTAAPVYSLSSPAAGRQDAKNNLIQQFPSMASLFGNLDFCQCEDCRSVLSPAAYFVDVLDMLGQHSAPNGAGNTPLDVLIGKAGVQGRRPDLGALPLTCENTNTALPYIDLVNEILEYYIAHKGLDANAATDTGNLSTADLVAEPQHILPEVYNSTLRQAVYPLSLPFDLWIDTVRGFLAYFKTPLAGVQDTFRAADRLELFTPPSPTACTRAQILSESLGISPAEYAVYTTSDTRNWFLLYGYADQPTALGGLQNAKTLSQKLGVTYQDVVDLTKTGFLNPSLYALIFQFDRFGIDMGTAFSFTGQAGYPALSAADKTAFQTRLDAITAEYVAQNPTSGFNATTWLTTLLPANYSSRVLVLADPDTGCNFGGTTLQFADGTTAQPIDFLKMNLLVRLWKKLEWSLDEVDRALQAFFVALPAVSDPTFDAAFRDAWRTALIYLAHLDDLNTRLAPALGRTALLPLWTDLPVQGENPLYAQLFLTPSVLNNDFAFDDPNGEFPWPSGDLAAPLQPLSAHEPSVDGVLGLTSTDVQKILGDASVASPAGFTLHNLTICYRYSLLAQCLQMPVSDLIDLKVMSGLEPFQALEAAPLANLADDILLNQTLEFVKQAGIVQNSGFTIEDLQFLLRQQFDPVGKYQTSTNSLIALLQSVASGLAQIQAANAVPPDLASVSESLIDQRLSALIPANILKSLFSVLGNIQTFTASAASGTPLTGADFASVSELTLNYDSVTSTQSASYTGLLADWRKSQIEALNSAPALAAVLDGLLGDLQSQARAALAKSVADLLGVWASLAQYEAVQTGVTSALAISDPTAQLTRSDASLSFAYDQASELQWLGYRGVLTDAKKGVLTGLNGSATLASLLNRIQQQTIPAYSELAGTLLALWTNGQTYKATQPGVASGSQLDATAFATALAAAQASGAIAGPVPAIQLGYDAASQTQTLVCAGVLTDALRGQLALLGSPLLGTVLQQVRDEAAQLFQSLATNLLTVAPGDLDRYVAPFLGVEAGRQQRVAKAELVKVFQPLLAQKLSRQLTLQTLATNLGSDPSLTEALTTDAALLDDPTNPGESLLPAFLAAGQPGVSASYYSAPNLTGAPIATGIAATADTADPTNSVPGAGSCRFEGYLQPATDGPYRFFLRLGDVGAQGTLRVDPPDPTALIPDPEVQASAAAAGDEFSQFIELKGGAAYHFTIEFQNLGSAGAAAFVQGENLAKGPLRQLRLYPKASVDGFLRARVLLSKALQILQTTGIGERELTYFAAHSTEFANLKLSSLPTVPPDDSVARAQALFTQFLMLADYADLRKGPAGGTDGLIDVFQAASQASPPASPAALLAQLTRRDPQTVQSVSDALGAEPHFLNNTGVRRLWKALQLVGILRLPVSAISDSTVIGTASPAAPDVIAARFKNAVKAQYTADQWRPIAKSVFDPLRQKKRDALVAYLVNALQFDSSNQLFEYFLVDPGMEPVVQTSRLRLAMSSVQTFVQRCLLNLENGKKQPALNVEPSAIAADRWTWMKRYRVWEANREIFLYPENYMEPELRLDKTDLFQALESALLEGDVTSDLAEDAFYTYLKGLDLRARLDIVASYLDQNPSDLSDSTLYVLGRTYGSPHKYFYRTYSAGTWSGWVAVTADIESDHIVLAYWRGRLNIFWLTFVMNQQAPPATKSGGSQSLASLPFSALSGDIFSAKPQQQLQIQLNWTEFVQGKWTPRISTDLKKAPLIDVPDNFDLRGVYVHVDKELDASKQEGALRVDVDVPTLVHVDNFGFGNVLQVRRTEGTVEILTDYVTTINYAFRVTSKNCDPAFGANGSADPAMPYVTSGIDATFHTGSSKLTAQFHSRIESDSSSTLEKQPILGSALLFELLTCGNQASPPFLPAGDPLYAEAGGLVSPFFFKDSQIPGAGLQSPFLDERTFFVQPSLTEAVVWEWTGWAVGPSVPPTVWTEPSYWAGLNLVAQAPAAGPVPVNPGDPAYSIFPMQNLVDWVTDPSVAVSYGGVAVGKSGGAVRAPSISINSGAVSSAGNLVLGGQGVDLSQAGKTVALPGAGIALAQSAGD